MKTYIAILAMLLCHRLAAQGDSAYWATFEAGYRPVVVSELLQSEQHKADSIEKVAPQKYYGRFDKYRCVGTYTGETRKIDSVDLASMSRVFKEFAGNPLPLESLVSSEVLFTIGEITLWMPVQNDVLTGFKEELNKGDLVTLYCAFFNEHPEKHSLTNLFLISGYRK